MLGSSSTENEDASQLAEGEGGERDDQKSCHLKGVMVFFVCWLHVQESGSRMVTLLYMYRIPSAIPLAVAGVTAAAACSGSFSQSPFKFWLGIACLPDDRMVCFFVLRLCLAAKADSMPIMFGSLSMFCPPTSISGSCAGRVLPFVCHVSLSLRLSVCWPWPRTSCPWFSRETDTSNNTGVGQSDPHHAMVVGKRIRSMMALREFFDIWKFAALPTECRIRTWSLLRRHFDLWKYKC